jgi:hypothetical protein
VIAAVLFQKDDSRIALQSVPTIVVPIAKIRQLIDLGMVFRAHTVLESVQECIRVRPYVPGS